MNRLKKLNGKLKDFEKIKFVVFGAKEKLIIIYKGGKFEKEVVWKNWFHKSVKEFKKEMREADAFNTETKQWTKSGDN